MGTGMLRRHRAAREAVPEPEEPKGNATTAEWAAWAAHLGIEVPDGAKRDEIKALVEAKANESQEQDDDTDDGESQSDESDDDGDTPPES